MARNIFHVSGLPSWGGPPNWFPPGGNYNLDDVHWFNAFKRTHGSGTNGASYFRASYANIGGQKYIYMSLRAQFVPEISDEKDLVLIGLKKKNGTKAMVIQIQVHQAGYTPAGPPSTAIPKAIVASNQVQYKTRSSTDTAWSAPVVPPSTWWIATNGHVWMQTKTDDPNDENYRWAVQLRIPVQATGDITDSAGPNIGDDFEFWYVIQGTASTTPTVTIPLFIGENKISGSQTTSGQITNGNYDSPFTALPSPTGNKTPWDEHTLASGPGSSDGVAIKGNGYNDVVILNTTYGTGRIIANGAENTFIVRPRNHRVDLPLPAPAGNATITAGNIGAFIRIANWGSNSSGGEDQTSAKWDYVPGFKPGDPQIPANRVNTPLIPVNSISDIPVLPNPTSNPSGDPIQLVVPNMTLAAGKSKHQCIYVNLTGTNLTFLNDSCFVNARFEPASLIEEEAEISVEGLEPVSSGDRTVYLATEKINLPSTTSPGTDEGKFLASTISRLIAQGGPLAEKLLAAREMLEGIGDAGSAERLGDLLNVLLEDLSRLEYSDPERGSSTLKDFIAALNRWLTAVKRDDGAAKRLARVFDALAEWLDASGLNRAAKLLAFISQLNQWLSSLNSDPASSEYLPSVLQAMRAWLSTLAEGARMLRIIEAFEKWLAGGHSPANLPELIKALSDLLSTMTNLDPGLQAAVESFSVGVARWLRGHERLQTFVNTLSKADLTEDEIDKVFPTFRVHVYHDTGERITGSDGKRYPVLSEQSSFGLYAYHEGNLAGWQTSIQGPGAQRVTENLYYLPVPNNGVKRVNIRIQAVEPGEERIPDDRIVPWDGSVNEGSCLAALKKALGPLGFLVDILAKLLGQKV